MKCVSPILMPLGIIVLLATAGYIAICATIYLLQERLIFFPESLPADYQFDYGIPFEEVTWEADGAMLHALHFKSNDPQGMVLYFHGNAGSLREWGMVAEDFVQLGYDVIIPDYRGYGKSTGRISSERQMLADGEIAYQYVASQLPEEGIILYGRSIGSGLAVYLARNHTPGALILESAYFSLRDLAARQIPGFIPLFLLKYPLRSDLWIQDVKCPIYLFHGTHDEVIPFDSSVRLAEQIQGPSEFTPIDGGHHNDLRDFHQYQEALRAILRERSGG